MPAQNNDEQELVARASRGDKMAISMLYNTHVQSIYQYVRYRVDTDMMAEDITSDVFLRMVRELPRYEDRGAPFTAWLYRIAYNCVVDYYRKHKRIIPDELPEQLSDDSPDPSDVLVQAEDHQQLQAALKTLSDDYQTVLILRFVNNLSHAEVGEAMDKSEAAARVLQHRALKALSNALTTMQSGGMA